MTTSDEILQVAQERIRKEAEGVLAVADQLDEGFLRAFDMILQLKGKVFVTGSGTSGIVARRMAHLLTVCGTPSVYIQPMDALHGAMGAVTRGDLLIAISKGGASTEINELVTRLQSEQIPVVSVTSAPESELARKADVSIVIENTVGSDPGGVVAMGSTLAVGVWGDALALILMIERRHTWDRVLHHHPAGAVGQITEPPPAPA